MQGLHSYLYLTYVSLSLRGHYAIGNVLLLFIRRINQGIALMIGPLAIDAGIGVTDTLIDKIKPLDKPEGRFVVRHYKSLNTVYFIFVPDKTNSPLNALIGIALMIIFIPIFISKAAAKIGSPKKVLKANGTNNLVGIILSKYPVS